MQTVTAYTIKRMERIRHACIFLLLCTFFKSTASSSDTWLQVPAIARERRDRSNAADKMATTAIVYTGITACFALVGAHQCGILMVCWGITLMSPMQQGQLVGILLYILFHYVLTISCITLLCCT